MFERKREIFIQQLLLLVSLVVLLSCTKDVSDEQAEKTMQEFQAALQAQDFDKALSYYSNSFFEIVPRESWEKQLKEVQEKLGAIQSFKLKERSVNTVFSGKRFIYIYNVTYAQDVATETIVLEQELTEKQAKIVVHKIDSKALRR